MSINVRDLCYRGGSFTLDVPELAISRGEITGVIGKNGSGKSTLLKVLEGYLEPVRGEISINGKDLTSLTPRELSRNISFVQQEIFDPLGFSVREVMQVSGYSRGNSFPEMKEALHMLAVEELIDRKFSELSGGERRLVAIASAIYQDSAIMLLDEPTTFLDVDKQMVVHSVLESLRNLGKTIVVVLHDLNAVYRLCDNIVVLKAGSVMAEGKTASIMKEETLRRAFDVEFEIYDAPDGKGFLPRRQVVYQ